MSETATRTAWTVKGNPGPPFYGFVWFEKITYTERRETQKRVIVKRTSPPRPYHYNKEAFFDDFNEAQARAIELYEKNVEMKRRHLQHALDQVERCRKLTKESKL